MYNKARRFLNIRMLKIIILILVILIGVGVLMGFRMRDILRTYEATQVKTQLSTVSNSVEDSFQTEIRYLQGIAYQVEQNGEHAAEIMENYDEGEEDITYGIMDITGNAIYGASYSQTEYECIRDSYHGNSAVGYSSEDGLMFSVPIYNNGNVKYILYKLYQGNAMADIVNLDCYEGSGYVILQDLDSKVIMTSDSYDEEAETLTQSSEFKAEMEVLREARNIEASSAEYVKIGGNGYFIFQAEIQGEALMLVGAVEEESVTEGVSYIETLVIWVYSLMIVLFLVLIFYLIIAEYKAEESDELREAKMVAEKASQTKSDFLASMSHEIRTPINAVIGMNEMILRESNEDATLSYAHNIDSASKNLLQIINDILDFSKIEAGKMDIVESDYKLSSMLNNIVNIIEIRAFKKDLALYTEIDEMLPEDLNGDVTRVQQIIINLLNNAVKYTPGGHVTLKMWGETKENEFHLFCQVADTGIGIKEEDLEKLFGDFTRIDQKRNQNIEGTGLGLAITKRLIDKMGGTISVESEYGKGSVFTAMVPQKVISEQKIGNFKESYKRYVYNNKSYKESFTAENAEILVVDDNRMNRQVVAGLLKKTKVKITEAEGGRQALSLLYAKKFDLVLMDHMMPDVDGIQALHQFREARPGDTTPFIALTANAIVGIREKYIAEGFQDYLSKPFAAEDLEKILIKFLPEKKITVTSGKGAAKAVGNLQTDFSAGEKSVNGDSENPAKESLLDHALGLQYCGDMEDFYEEMKQEFAAESGENQKKLETYYEAKNWADYITSVHALKSTSLSIGARTLSECAKELELAGKRQEYDFILANHGKCMEMYQAVIEEIRGR